MLVTIYRSSVKDGLYVYMNSESQLESLPKAVMKQLGEPEVAMELDLDENRKLSNANATEVLTAIEQQGCYVQMPRDIEAMLAGISGTQNVPEK